jgi:UDPglucose--hexose-1-phosphate uridylyltransferase
VIISTERGKRPMDFDQKPAKREGRFCPFCVGNEDKTPPEILAFRQNGSAPNSPGWDVRVVPNKFPALQIEGDLDRRAEGIFDKMNGIGAHEVVIETTSHEAELSELGEDHVALIVRTYIERLNDLKKDRRFRYILVFKNHGEAAGASLEHAHTQLIATPIIPIRVVEEIRGAESHFEMKERCIFCDVIQQELTDQKRIVSVGSAFVALEPFAPRFPFETWILPRQHSSSFEQLDAEGIKLFARALKETLTRLNRALSNPPYNFVIHTAPCHSQAIESFHWHVELMPKLTRVAGFEWGTGFYINPTPPEDAARYLREISLEVPAQ